MECNILKELAVFDPNAPINVSISFEDGEESVEFPITSENITDDNIKVEIKEEPINILETSEEVTADTRNEQNIIHNSTSLVSDSLQNNTNSNSRKRKTTQLNIYKNKNKSSRGSMSEPNNQPSLLNDSENVCENAQDENGPVQKSNATPDAELLNKSKNCNVNQLQNDNLSSYIRRYLLPVSKHMQIIIEAYLFHMNQKTKKDDFINLKNQLFSLSYKTVVAILLPEEKNVDFIQTFLKETHRLACEAPTVYKGTLKDYESLLRELLRWTKTKKSFIHKTTLERHTVSNSSPDKNNQNLNKTLEQNPLCNVIEISKNAEKDKICIFSAGVQGNEISINVDPALQKYLHNINTTNTLNNNQLPNPANVQKQPLKTSNSPAHLYNMNTTNTIDKNHARNTHVNSVLSHYLNSPPLQCKNSTQDVLNQPTGRPVEPRPSNISNFNYQSQRDSGSNNTYVHRNASSLERLTQTTTLQSSQVLSHTPQQYGLSSQGLQQQQSTPSKPQVQYWQSQLVQQQNEQINHAESLEIWQSHQVMSQYGQQQRHNPPSYDQVNRQRQLQQQYNLSSQNAAPPSSQCRTSNYIPTTHYGQVQPGLPQYGQVQSGQARNIVLPQYAQTQPINIQSENLGSTDWQQSNMLQYQTQTRNTDAALRTVSTDSGFISPLNFMSSEQTVPRDLMHTPSEGKETANLLITHVTSLNPKVAFIEEGKCAVCKRTTKQVCMGCMQRYYCSYDCQLVDWSNHEPSCKHANT